MPFRKAERKKAKLRLALSGPSGSGKTYSALLIAFGIGGKVAMIDTERGSGELYAHLGDYDVCTLEPPFTPQKYIQAIKEAENLGYDVLIIDSLSHAWAGQGGMLEMHDRISAKSGNSWAAWRQVTPQHNALVDAMLQSSCHIIATLRAKTEYAQTEENGKTVIKRLGLAPVFRDGIEYEFTIFLDLSPDHTAMASKDRTGLLDGQAFVPDQKLGKVLLEWLESGADPIQQPKPQKDNHKYRKQFFAKFSEWVKSQNLDSTAADHACSAVLCEAFQVDSRSKLTEEQWQKCLQPNWFNSLCSKVLEFLKKENAANA